MPAYTFRVNGESHRIEGEPSDSLLSVLRDDLKLTGSKFGCGEGHCGACTVMLDGLPTRSCVVRLVAVQGRSVTTIESLSTGTRLHPVQEAFLAAEAFQCGYCTTGMIMATIGFLATNPDPTDADIAKLMDRNVCRCGTYPRIVTAIKDAAKRMKGSGRTEGGSGFSPTFSRPAGEQS